MRVLILGSGGRENALYHALKKSHLIDTLYALPGNGGFPPEALVSDISLTDFEAILSFVGKKEIQLIIVGPEVPLALGIKDFFAQRKSDTLIFGPDQNSARLEASKAFAADYMKKKNIPTAKSATYGSLEEAFEAIQNHSTPIVIKADGLAAGKGVSIHTSLEEAKQRLKKVFEDKIFGDAGEKVLIQDFMQGNEASLFALCDGGDAVYFPNARDYKPVFEANQGPNTGGMGAYCPTELLNEDQIGFIHERIVKQILRDFSYTGILYIGLMVHSQAAEDVSVVEFNCRFGDPETQAILPLLESDILPYFLWSCGHSEMIAKIKAKGFYHLSFKNKFSVNVVLAAKGYPEDYEKEISFSLPDPPEDVQIIHAGTRFLEEDSGEKYISNGGRILNIVGIGSSLDEARNRVYHTIDLFKKLNQEQISRFHFREDIGFVQKEKRGRLA